MLPRDAQMGDVCHVAQRLGMNEEGKIMPKVCENTSCFRERVYENIVYVKMSFRSSDFTRVSLCLPYRSVRSSRAGIMLY